MEFKGIGVIRHIGKHGKYDKSLGASCSAIKFISFCD